MNIPLNTTMSSKQKEPITNVFFCQDDRHFNTAMFFVLIHLKSGDYGVLKGQNKLLPVAQRENTEKILIQDTRRICKKTENMFICSILQNSSR